MAIDNTKEISLPFGNFSPSQLQAMALDASLPYADAQTKANLPAITAALNTLGLQPVAYDDSGNAPDPDTWLDPTIKPIKPGDVVTKPAFQNHPLAAATYTALHGAAPTTVTGRQPRFTPGPGQPTDPATFCDPGYFYDEYNHICVPTQGTSGAPGTTGTDSATGSLVQVTVNNAVTLSAGVGQAIADAVTDGINNSIDEAAAVQRDASNAITQGIDKVVNTMADGVKSFVGQLYDSLKSIGNYIYSHISDLVNFITNNIGKVINTISDVITNVIVPVIKQVKTTLDTVNDVISNTIAPIFKTIQDTYNQTVALVKAIKDDITHGITGILQLPTDVANGITGIDASLARLGTLLGGNIDTSVGVRIGGTEKDSIWTRLSELGKGVNILGSVGTERITIDESVRLSEPSLCSASAQSVTALGNEIADFVHCIFNANVSALDKAKSVLPLTVPYLGIELGSWVSAFTVIRELDQLFEPFYKFAKEDLSAKAGLSKLPVGQVLEAWRRGIVGDLDLAEDLAVNGWDKGRIQVLKDLQGYLIDANTAIDMWRRKQITAEERDNAMRKLGISGDQMVALVQQSYKLFSVGTAELAFKFKLIDEQALDAVFQENRLTADEITARKATMFRKRTVEEQIAKERRELYYSGLGYSPEGFDSPSPAALEAGFRDGEDSTVTLDRWQASYFVLPLQEWIACYFRGLCTQRELNAALDYYRVPARQRVQLIDTHRALIPFRTIPAMVASGIISEAYAKQQLAGHGFDLVAIEALLKYAQSRTATKKVAASGDVFGLSVATARGYFDAGTINAEQYKAVLLAHGYDEQSATFAVNVEKGHSDMLARKQLASDLVAEVQSGIMTLDQAQNMMDSHQFSEAEKAKVLTRINKTKRQAFKVPSESELHSMASKNVISVDQYRQGMVAQGWTEPYLSWFVNWRFPSAAIIPSTA